MLETYILIAVVPERLSAIIRLAGLTCQEQILKQVVQIFIAPYASKNSQ